MENQDFRKSPRLLNEFEQIVAAVDKHGGINGLFFKEAFENLEEKRLIRPYHGSDPFESRSRNFNPVYVILMEVIKARREPAKPRRPTSWPRIRAGIFFWWMLWKPKVCGLGRARKR